VAALSPVGSFTPQPACRFQERWIAGFNSDTRARVVTSPRPRRALRGDLAEAAQRSLHSQLLLGRLQMQEQRLTYLDRQRSEVTATLMQQTTVTAGIASQVKRMESCDVSPDPRPRQECELMAENFKRQLSGQQKMEQQLRARESDLLNTVATEQALWSDFNARLDELERALTRR
jgi:hypothetical protein